MSSNDEVPDGEELEDMLFDSHFHYWATADRRYPWLLPSDRPTSFADIATLPSSYLPSDYARDAGGTRVRPAVFVEAGTHQTDWIREIEWVHELKRTHGSPDAIVAAADLTAPDIESYLSTIGAYPLVRGVRHITTWDPDSSRTFVRDETLMQREDFVRGAALVARAGLSLDVQIYPSQMAPVAALARKLPHLSVILEHTLMPRVWQPHWNEEWRSATTELAQLANVACKVGGLGMTMNAWTIKDAIPLFEFALEAFGASRVMFGSNFPVERQRSDLAMSVDAYRAVAKELGAEGEQQALHGSVSKWYDLMGTATDARRRAFARLPQHSNP